MKPIYFAHTNTLKYNFVKRVGSIITFKN